MSFIDTILDDENIEIAINAAKNRTVLRGMLMPAGVDGIELCEFDKYFDEHWNCIKHQIKNGTYEPNNVRIVSTNNTLSGKRLSYGIYTVIDRVIQYAIVQAITNNGIYTPNSVQQISESMKDEDDCIIRFSIMKILDTIDHEILMHILEEKIDDVYTLRLIKSFLSTGSPSYGKGIYNTSPMAPMFVSFYLSPLEKELKLKDIKYVIFCDELYVFVKDENDASKVIKFISHWIEQNMKTAVSSNVIR